jgi:hypothetical protein
MMAQALQIDTLAFSEKLQAAGADVLLAKAIVEGISSVDTSTLATKEELRNVEAALKLDLQNLESALKLDLRNVESALKLDSQNLESALKLDLQNLESALKLDSQNLESAFKLDLQNLESAFKLEIATSANTIITRLGAIIAVMLGIVGALQLFA